MSINKLKWAEMSLNKLKWANMSLEDLNKLKWPPKYGLILLKFASEVAF